MMAVVFRVVWWVCNDDGWSNDSSNSSHDDNQLVWEGRHK